MMIRKSAQSILEYVIVLTAIVAAIMVATNPGGVVRTAIDNMFQNASNVITNSSTNFQNQVAGGTVAK